MFFILKRGLNCSAFEKYTKMNNKINIALVCGGSSSERPVSFESAKGVESILDKEKYHVFIVCVGSDEDTTSMYVQWNGMRFNVDRNNFSFELNGKTIRFDFAYITVHGEPGENGVFQGYLESVNVPYSTCGVLTSALTYNKYKCAKYLDAFSIRSPETILVDTRKSEFSGVKAISYPRFMKPNLGGSSIGACVIASYESLMFKLFDKGVLQSEFLLQELLSGTEVTCGAYQTYSGINVLPITEIKTDNEFFDYEAKYQGKSREITPAEIGDDLTRKIQDTTKNIYEILGCRGIVRIDYIIMDGEVYFLEVNTTPGMTSKSIIPQQIKSAGLDITQVFTDIIEFNKKLD